MAAQLTITDRKHVIHADIERMAVFLQGKFVEATGDDGRLWYVIFYKDHYLNAYPPPKSNGSPQWRRLSVTALCWSLPIR